jgi:thioester reductase-like protein
MLRPNGVISNSVDARAADIEAAISRYMPDLSVTSPKVVLLTGSTGNLGSYLLGSLMRCHSVQKIYCLNRSSEAAERQAKGNALRGLPCTREDSRVVFLQFDASRKDLGLAPDVQKEILATATDIIHNAWTVDFNRSLSSFHPNIAGVRHLVEFAQKSPSKPSIFFISSIGTARRWADAGNAGSIPEEIAADISIVDHGGYPESKYIAERLLQAAWTRISLKTCVLRVGQVAGPVRSLQGQWNPVEWLPTIIQSSVGMGMLPQTIGALDVVDWIPVDVLSDVVTEILHQDWKDVSKFPVYNLVNPFRTTWQALVPKIRETLTASTGKEVRLVEYSEWLAGLQEASLTLRTDEELRRVPGVKLLHFFESIPYGRTGPTATWSTKTAQQVSKTLKECTAVTPEWMDLWMRQWEYTINKATF